MAAYAEAIDGSRTCRQWMGTVWIQQAHQSHKSMSRMSFLSVDYWSWALEAKVMLLMRHVVNKIVAYSTANKQRRGGRLQPEVASVKLRSQTAAGRWIICGSLVESCKSWRFRIIFFWLWFTMVQLIGFECFPNYVSLKYESFLSILKKNKKSIRKEPGRLPRCSPGASSKLPDPTQARQEQPMTFKRKLCVFFCFVQISSWSWRGHLLLTPFGIQLLLIAYFDIAHFKKRSCTFEFRGPIFKCSVLLK